MGGEKSLKCAKRIDAVFAKIKKTLGGGGREALVIEVLLDR